MPVKIIVSKILAYNPVSHIVFLLTGKRVSFNHLTIRVIAFLLRQRIPFDNITIDVSDKVITPLTKSLLYYGIYEKNEIAFVRKYLKADANVIELGSSIGVMGSVISTLQTTGRYISVEADPALIEANRKNMALNRKTDYVLLNKAVDYSNKPISFLRGESSLRGKVVRNNSTASKIIVKTITLNQICNIYNLDNFTLVSDIEGAEITILLNDEMALNKCEKMIIELHNTEYNGKIYLVQDMVDIIVNNDFNLIDRCRDVFVFKNNGINYEFSEY